MTTAFMSAHARRMVLVVAVGGLALASTQARAEPLDAAKDCASLPGESKAAARKMLGELHPYDGCDETFEKCLARKAPHPIVVRVASDVCRQVKAGMPKRDIERALAKRAQSALPMGKLATFVHEDSARAGDAGAPVVVTVYACARCPFCKVMVPALHEAVTNGPLKGKARLYFRPFPLKDHAGSMEGGLAMASAGRLGAMWPYILHLYKSYDAFCPKLLPEWAAALGLDRAAFEKHYADSTTRDALVASKQEGIRNKVTATPTIFINGRKYVYDLNIDAVVDVLLEESERTTKGDSR
jgi:protein-disulfide isomerase